AGGAVFRRGRTASGWQEKWVVPGLRRLDFYPPHLYLLPNGEIHYQRDFPARILFFCDVPPERGGETFLHSADATEAAIVAQGPAGRDLLAKLRAQGQMIETGFLDRDHPRKKQNYHQSWQERFGTDDRDAALAVAKSRSREYDDCWWVEDEGYPVLMTRITLPGFFEGYMRFSRIAADGPSAQNGFRRFPFGDGTEFSEAEKRLLKQAYLATAQGTPWHQGDLILMDNIRYAHSRAPFAGKREVYLGMAGMKQINK
ncbi:MAG TPA: TauD/TfdA family dioxygenase, partial [Patescibacteria group bacterium]|nr:TauD/TfdA family dioxygenase [Patescibacteria group bacterium]